MGIKRKIKIRIKPEIEIKRKTERPL